MVVGGVGDLGHGACRRRGALRGRWGQAADGCDPLDVAGGHQPVAIRPAAVEAADSRTQAIAVGSTVTTASAWPTTRLPSLASMSFSLEIGNCFRIAAHQIWWTGSVYAVSVHLTRAIQ